MPFAGAAGIRDSSASFMDARSPSVASNIAGIGGSRAPVHNSNLRPNNKNGNDGAVAMSIDNLLNDDINLDYG